MKKIAVLFSAFFMLAVANVNASVEKYTINDDAVETVLNEGVVVNSVFDIKEVKGTIAAPQATLDDKRAVVAAVLAWVVGWLGIHRVYLGGRGVLVAFYLLTSILFGIGGVIALIDLVVLLINMDDISKFVGNDKFLMWLD